MRGREPYACINQCSHPLERCVACRSAAQASQVEDVVANARDLFYTVYPKGGRAFVSNVLSGFTVSLAMIPEAVAFAFVAGVSPIVGLWTAVVMGFFAAAFGGRGGVVTGASGACAVYRGGYR